MYANIRRVLDEVLSIVKPRPSDYYYLHQVAKIVSNAVSWCLEEYGFPSFSIELQGSFAKDTFLRNDVDIDIFVLFEENTRIENPIEKFVYSIKCCLESRGFKVFLRYATHPYITLVLNGIEIDIVPAYRVKTPTSIITAVDRTPFHTRYVLEKLSPAKRDEVRLLKTFMKRIGVYGAEVRVQGFSGYLTELLIIYYGSFLDVLRASEKWRPYKTCIDIEGFYRSEAECIRRFRGSPLIVVDPVDPKRNAAASVSLRSFSIFRLCAKMFLECPSTRFFFKPRVKVDTDFVNKLVYRVEKGCSEELRGFYLVKHRVAGISEDVIWGQLRRFERSLINTLKCSKIRVLSIDSYLDMHSLQAYTILDIYLGALRKHIHEGPPLTELENALKFIKKNVHASVPPWVGIENRLLCIKDLDIGAIIRKHLENLGLEFVKPIEIIDLCKEREKIREFPEDVLQWIHDVVEKNMYVYLLEPCIESST